MSDVDLAKYNFGIKITDTGKIREYYKTITDDEERLAFRLCYSEGICKFCKEPIWACEDHAVSFNGLAHEKCMLENIEVGDEYVLYRNPLKKQLEELES